MKKITASLFVLLLSLSACKKEAMNPSYIYLMIKGDLGYSPGKWSGVSLDPNMPNLCSGGGTKSMLRVLVHAAEDYKTRNNNDRAKDVQDASAWVSTSAGAAAFPWFHGERNLRVSCNSFDIKVMQMNYDPLANDGKGKFVDAGIAGTVNDDCSVTINADIINPRALDIRVKTKITGDQINTSDGRLSGVEVRQVEQNLFINCK